MLLEIFTKTEDGTENDRYVSVKPESLQIRRNPDFTGKAIPADANPHVLAFIGKPMSCLNKNTEPWVITLTTDTTFRLLSEKSEKCPNLDLRVFIGETPSTLFKGVKIQRNEGLTYRATSERVILSVKYKEIAGDKASVGKYYSATFELFNRSSAFFNETGGDVREIKLITTRKDVT